ncbi:AAA+ family ATPase [Rhodophyticola sp. CCM32]|uniref:AAA+ family ATPase n=1 Tax=Rhodophyticola sp. CCM32 TaxID=2916397 RepID=UPI00107FC221|nr:AAA+ family ATPase [Rhodophyticola sp. CCM32]QBY01063.1 AAA+ family ATPase [Rhodophyticola sp. CCM32]
MKQLAPAVLSLCLLAPPVMANDDGPPDSNMRDGFDLFARGAELMLEGLRDEMTPMLEDIRPFLEHEMLPFMQGLAEAMDDLTAYHPPERLPNGDILIRRRDDAPDLPEIGEGGEVEL